MTGEMIDLKLVQLTQGRFDRLWVWKGWMLVQAYKVHRAFFPDSLSSQSTAR